MFSRGRASLLPRAETRINPPINLVVIIGDVRREVCLFSHPVTFSAAETLIKKVPLP
jgi:hypothetical protein